MLAAISFKIYELRKYLLLSLAISMIAIPIGNSLVIQTDRNRNEMYGEAFWIYGFHVYDMNDQQVAAAMGPLYQDGNHTLPAYLGNITYEYPVFGLIFFAIATYLFPGNGSNYQEIWLNFLLVLVFNLNLVLIAILLKDKIYNSRWARLLLAGYFVYGLMLSAGGGKLEPLADCLLLMALVLHTEGQHNKAMFTLGLAFQTKIYPLVALPILFVAAPLSIVWFLASLLLSVVPMAAAGLSYGSLFEHFLNSSSYSSVIVNPLFPGLAWGTPDVAGAAGASYIWPPALVPTIIVGAFFLMTFRQFLPDKKSFGEASWWGRLELLVPFYIYCVPCLLFVFRWVMPWYLFWFGALIFLYKKDEHAVAYLKLLVVIGLCYAFGVVLNYPYFGARPLPDLLSHFPLGVLSYAYLAAMIVSSIVAFGIWRWSFNRREAQQQRYREIEDRGELII